MMYLSHLLINVGDNPDRPRPGRTWLRNMYHVHQRLCMAFPSDERKAKDPDFLRPFSPGDFPEDGFLADRQPDSLCDEGRERLRHVHAPRDSQSGFLFRVDPLPGASVAILVLSAIEPNWDYAFQNAGFLLAAPPATPRPLALDFAAGTPLRFRLVANPVFRAREASPGPDGQPLDAKWKGKRVPVPGDDESLTHWLERRGAAAGFALRRVASVQAGYVFVGKAREENGRHRLRSARYEGLLEVTDADAFRATLAQGIGPAKAYGFGLLSVAPVRAGGG